jgi:hypothetical protein
MKKLILIPLLVIILSGFGQNRVVQKDDGIYKAGDIIIDTPTRIAPGTRDVVYYFMTKYWPTIKDSATIWLDGDKLGELTGFVMRNGPKPTTPWQITTATFKNVPGTKVKSRTFNIVGLKNIKVEGSIDPLEVYQTGRFGFHADNKIRGGHGFEISVLDGGTIEMSGIEAQGGFSGVRLNGEKVDALVQKLLIHDFYIHDTFSGEGFYIGSTKAPPYSRFQNVEITNGYIARTAGEAIQLQHMSGNVDIHHIQVYCADTGWMNMFMPGQSTGFQWSVDGGENKMHHMILDGFATQGMVPFGGDIAAPPGSKSIVSDILYNNGLLGGMYLHKSMTKGVEWIFNNIHYRNFSDMYCRVSGTKPVDNIISSPHGTDKVIFSNITYDDTKLRVFEKKDDPKERLCSKISDKEDIKYNRSGFTERPTQIRQWFPHIAGYFPLAKSSVEKIRTTWEVGDIAIDADREKQTYRFYKCVQAHASTTIRPAENSAFKLLVWDSNGVRNDQEGFNNQSVSYYPPDDLRIIGKWKELGVPYEEVLID